jgi:hypothetical protein
MKVFDQTKTYYNPLEIIGKHYLISRKFDHTLKRHYTVSNCMKKEVYEEYLNVIT